MDDQLKELRDLILERDHSLRVHLDERFAQIDERFNQIDERDRLLRDYIDERFAQVELRFTQMHDYTNERSHDIETRLLTEFHKWATRIESTLKPLPIRMGGYEERVALIEERLKDLDNPRF